MKLLIIAGPYEADRIRRAVVSEGFEAVAVEPGESLSSWINATRPDVIVLAPQIVSPDPAIALGKVRAVPRGRVPVFLVGDAEEESQLAPLGDGFLCRPVSPEVLMAKAKEAAARVEARVVEEVGSGRPSARAVPVVDESGRAIDGGAVPGSGPTRASALRPLVATRDSGAMAVPAAAAFAGMAAASAPVVPAEPPWGPSAPDEARAHAAAAGSGAARGRATATMMLEQLSDKIDADFDAEIRDVVRAVGALRQAAGAAADAASAAAAGAAAEAAADEALDELKDESSQKTLEVPQVASSAVGDGEDGAAGAAGERRSAATAQRSERKTPAETDLDLPSLLARMYLSRMSGRLTLGAGKARKYIVFDRGHAVLAASNQPEDRMGQMLVREGRFTAEEMVAFGGEAAGSGRRLGAVLLERGLIDAPELASAVRRHYEEIIGSLFAWRRGAWNLGPDSAASVERILVSRHPAALILAGIRRAYDPERALAAIGGPGRMWRLRSTASTSALFDHMGLGVDERNVALLFDGTRTVAEIAAEAGTTSVELAGLAYALLVIERLEATDAMAAEPSIGAGRRQTLAAARDQAIDRALVQSRHALIVEGDYFQILGVPRNAGAQDVRRAHSVLVGELDSENLHPVVVAEMTHELAEIRLVLDEAERFLTDDPLRRRYRDHLPVPDAAPSA